MPGNRRLLKIILLICFVALLPGAFPMAAKAQSQTSNSYLIVNQVRGGECCGEGSVHALEQQIQHTLSNGLEAYFAFRYDALVDPQFIHQFETTRSPNPGLTKPALLLEITPQLAKVAGVPYNGDIEHWYKSKQVYTLGYQPEDRKKIIDALMDQYKKAFGSYPELTSSWMIDTDTLNYVADVYGVEVHQITRDQWGVDSYTLYGGPIHYPYPASRNWLFMPDYIATNSTFIVRQTISDPLRNYGDLTSAFTSQPNDYFLDGKDFSYFRALADQTLNERNEVGFMLLGLENSMNEFSQNEYFRQLAWLNEQVEQDRIKPATLESLNQQFGTEKPRVWWGKDLVENANWQSWWITTGVYRMRILQRDTQVWITDLRLYDKNVSDFYNQSSARTDGFWVTPFLVDASMTHVPSENRKWWQQLLLPPNVQSSRMKAVPDFAITPNALRLPDKKSDSIVEIEKTNDQVLLSYPAESGTVRLQFNNTSISFAGVEAEQVFATYSPSQHFPIELDLHRKTEQWRWSVNNETAYSATISPTEAGFDLSFKLNPEMWPNLRDTYYYYFFPELKLVNNPDPEKTIFYVNNRFALAGRNPVRMVLAPKDERGIPVGLSSAPVITADPIAVISDPAKQQASDLQFFDIASNQPQKTQVIIKMGDSFQKQETIYFAPDCKKQLGLCLRHPEYFYWFARVKIWDKWLSQL